MSANIQNKRYQCSFCSFFRFNRNKANTSSNPLNLNTTPHLTSKTSSISSKFSLPKWLPRRSSSPSSPSSSFSSIPMENCETLSANSKNPIEYQQSLKFLNSFEKLKLKMRRFKPFIPVHDLTPKPPSTKMETTVHDSAVVPQIVVTCS